jgi:broad-specificity NMP kinase
LDGVFWTGGILLAGQGIKISPRLYDSLWLYRNLMSHFLSVGNMDEDQTQLTGTTVVVRQNHMTMNHVLITGMSGVGKTTVVEELRHRGFICIDMDEPGWSFMDPDGHQHWDVERLERVMNEAGNKRFFVSGCAEEQAALYHRFRAIILLSAPRQVMVERICSRSSNSYGQNPEEMARILADLDEIEPHLRERCTYEIETTAPVNDVVDRILALTCPTRRCRGCAEVGH